MSDYYFEEPLLTLRDNEAWQKSIDMEVCANCRWERNLHRATDNACPVPQLGERVFSETQRFALKSQRVYGEGPRDE